MIFLRTYRKGDEEAVLSILERSLAEYGLKTDTNSTDADVVDIDRSYMRAGGMFKILEKDGKAVGTFGIYRISDANCELRKMYLEPELKGHGLGRMMMEDSLEEARKLGFTRMILETNSVLVEAIGMYRKFGFREFMPEHLSSRCDIAMERHL